MGDVARTVAIEEFARARALMPASDRILAGVVDMRVRLTFGLEDCALIARIIRADVSAVYQASAGA